jgi:hypothetical protein
MAEKKSIYEGALLDINVIQEALNANAKEILRSVAREEIDGLVKESLEEGDYTEEAIEDEVVTSDSEEEPIEGSDDDDDDAIEIGGDESDDEDEKSPEVGPEDDQEMGMDAADADMGDDLDMTDASDDDVIAIYKKLSGDDEIEIVGDEIHLNISEPGEYIVKKGALGMDESMYESMDETYMEEGWDEMEEGYEENEGLTYEIAMGEDSTMMEGDEEEEDEKLPEPPEEKNPVLEDEESEGTVAEVEMEEGDKVEEKIGVGTGMSVGTHRNKTGPGSIGAPENPKSKNESVSSKNVITEAEVKYKKLLNEATQLKAENEEFRQALKKFRGMLVETVVFNSNLSYVTKLFMEHSTTKDEKKKIIQRFDEEVTNLKESKKLYKTIVNELTARKPVNESIENKIIKEVATGSSKQLNEATAYVDPSTQRIKDLISRVENKDKY